MPKRSEQTAGPSQRQQRVAELVRHALAEVLARGDIQDPVLTKPCHHHPRGAHVAGPEARDRLRHAARRRGRARGASRRWSAIARTLRQEVARRVTLKFAPDLRFRRDESFDEAARIDALLRTEKVQRDVAKR